ncbi:MAG: hypothetical protein OQL19_08035 [Gammaproteobacteria bacterium]|nr:hypothetical protein [Gammaproteobacteria bacterium]
MIKNIFLSIVFIILVAVIPFAGHLFTPSEEPDSSVLNYILSKDFLIIVSTIIFIFLSVTFYWQKIKRLLMISPLIIVISGIIGNLSAFSEMNTKYPTQLSVNNNSNLQTQLLNKNNPYRDTFGLYYFLKPYLNGRTLNIYNDELLKEDLLKHISKVSVISHDNYQHRLTNQQVSQLLQYPQKTWNSENSMDLVVILSSRNDSSKIFILKHKKILYFVPERLINISDRSY